MPSTSQSVDVRAARADDAAAIAVLLGQLGYPASPADVAYRVMLLENFPNSIARVAVQNGAIVGVVTGHAYPSIHSATIVAYLTSLVVAEGARGRGVGKRLVVEIERWASGLGAARISVTSGVQRDDAHAFYRQLGYEQSGLRFSKSLT